MCPNPEKVDDDDISDSTWIFSKEILPAAYPASSFLVQRAAPVVSCCETHSSIFWGCHWACSARLSGEHFPGLLSPVPPSFRDSSGEQPVQVSVRVGNSVTLECESNAVPPPTITWYKNGRMVMESGNIQILAGGQMLEIKGAEVHGDTQSFCFFVHYTLL